MAQEASAPVAPRKPGQEEVRRHMLTHLPYAPWCEACIKGRGREAAHRRRAQPEEGSFEEVQLDYFFANVRQQEGGPEQASTLKHLAVYAPRYGYGAASTVLVKGASDSYAVGFVKAFLNEVGFNGPLLIQTDSERSIQDLARAVANSREARTVLRHTPVGDHQANGGVERWIQSVCGMARTLLADLESNYGVRLVESSVLIPWVIRHSGWLLSRFSQDSAKHTPFQRVHGRVYTGDVFTFAETILGKECLSAPERRPKLEDGFVRGIWLGRSTSSGEHLLGTTAGVVRCRTARRVPEEDQHNVELLTNMRGAPWNAAGGRTVQLEGAQPQPPEDRQVGKFASDFRRFIQDSGPTPNCSGCQYPAGG